MKKIINSIVIVSFLGINIIIFAPQINRSHVKIKRTERKIEEIDIKLLAFNEEIKEYSEKIEKLKIPYYREKIGREKLQMVKEDEEVYKLAN
ncbi:MAG: septum formation initiator family protein [Fusobacteriaceae bacterium]